VELVALGLSHRTAPLAVRERAALSETAVAALLRELVLDPRVAEAAALSTCNRTEIYAAVRSLEEGVAAISKALVGHTRLSHGELVRARCVLAGPGAAEHLLRVAASLESMVLGESEIQGQVRQGIARAERAGSAGPLLRELFRRALVTGKRVRRATGIARGAASVSQAAAELALGELGDPATSCALVLGAGRAAGSAALALARRGIEEIVVMNRSHAAADELARRVHGRSAPIGALGAELARADLAVCSTGSPVALLGPPAVRAALAERPSRPLVLVDIAVPRDVEPGVRVVPGVLLFDIDDLEAAVRESRLERAREARRAEAIVAEELERHLGPREAYAACA
jgi:glutamyl-tRNA reductase